MNIVYKECITVEEYNTLREAVGWKKICNEQALKGLEHSAYIVSGYEDDKIIGAARIIWDKGYVAYLADVMVIPEYQGRGIGKNLVEKAVAFTRLQLKEGWRIEIVLHSSRGKEGFYKKIGFNEKPTGMELGVE